MRISPFAEDCQQLLEFSTMLKNFKMPFLRNTKKGNSQEPRRTAGPDDYRAMLKRFKTMLGKMGAVNLGNLEWPESLPLPPGMTRKEMEAVREGYLRNGRALWNYARAVIKELPEPEREKEMAEIKKLLERAGFRESMNEAQ